MTTLPSIETLDKPTGCAECGGPVVIVGPVYCPTCEDAKDEQRRRESGNEYRRHAMLRLEREMVKSRARAYVSSKAAPIQHTCAACGGSGGFVTFGDDKHDGGAECSDCNGSGVVA